jgi:AcrR family transcriptional regulator
MELMKSPSGAGRPRDEQVGKRALTATRQVFAERGWFGTSFDEVAKRAGVGKSSLYLRWPTKAELVVAAIAPAAAVDKIDAGSLREDAVQLGHALLERQLSGEGQATLRFAAEARYVPQLREAAAKFKSTDSTQAARAIVRRATARGELPTGTPPALLHDLVSGAVLAHVVTVHGTQTAAARAKSQAYVTSMVDVVLQGLVSSTA